MAIMWHGGSRWDGVPEIRAAKKGRAEWGPGIYGTTSYFRAANQYAKGGKVVQLVEFAPRLLLRQAAIGLDTLTAFVCENAPKSKRTDILGRLQNASARHNADGLSLLGHGPMVHADFIVNMWVNTDLSSGVKGPLLSRFLVDLGIDAVSDSVSPYDGVPEFWTVIFNPDSIKRHDVYLSKDVGPALWHLPDPSKEPAVTVDDFLDRIAEQQKESQDSRFSRPRC